MNALVNALEELSAAVRPLSPLGRPALASLATRLLPVWSRAGAVAALAPPSLLPPLCTLAKLLLKGSGPAFAPLLQPTVQVLTTALLASPADAAPLLGFANSIVDVFCDQPTVAAAFSGLLDQLVTPVLEVLRRHPAAEHADLTASVLHHADMHAKLALPSLLASASWPALHSLAVSQLQSCRTAEPVLQACELLAGIATKCRTLKETDLAAGTARGDAEAVAVLRARLVDDVSGAAAEALLTAVVRGLADTLPPVAVPRAADLLAPLLHLPAWRASLNAWATAALTGVPTTDGVPDAHARESVRGELCGLPDPFPPSGGLAIDVVERLRGILCEFARVCRRMESAAAFDVAAYHWKAM